MTLPTPACGYAMRPRVTSPVRPSASTVVESSVDPDLNSCASSMFNTCPKAYNGPADPGSFEHRSLSCCLHSVNNTRNVPLPRHGGDEE